MADPTGPRPLWLLAHAAVENNYDVTIQRRGSSVALIARRGKTEVVARWQRADLNFQGDGEGRWKPTGRASMTDGGDTAWIGLTELRDWFARPGDDAPAADSDATEPDSANDSGCRCTPDCVSRQP